MENAGRRKSRLEIPARCLYQRAQIDEPRQTRFVLAALAQSVEHIIRNDGVTCSSHVSGTISSFVEIEQPESILPLGRRCDIFPRTEAEDILSVLSAPWQIEQMALSVRRSLVVFFAMLVLSFGPARVNAGFAAGSPREMAGTLMASAHMHGASEAVTVHGDDCCAKERSRSCPDCVNLRSCEAACAVPAILADASSAAVPAGPGSERTDADVLVTGMLVKPPTEPPKA